MKQKSQRLRLVWTALRYPTLRRQLVLFVLPVWLGVSLSVVLWPDTSGVTVIGATLWALSTAAIQVGLFIDVMRTTFASEHSRVIGRHMAYAVDADGSPVGAPMTAMMMLEAGQPQPPMGTRLRVVIEGRDTDRYIGG